MEIYTIVLKDIAVLIKTNLGIKKSFVEYFEVIIMIGCDQIQSKPEGL